MNIITIDGPAGSGKSTTAKLVAERLGFTYLDTGAMYRAVAWLALERGVNLEDSDAIAEMAEQMVIDMETSSRQSRVWVDGREITEDIRQPVINKNVSKVAALAGVRAVLVRLQKKIAENKNAVVEGRDIGTVVFPDAALKFFLVASPEARAHRRQLEQQARGIQSSFDDVLLELKKRDQMDSSRTVAPLQKAVDAIEIDTTDLTIEAQVSKIVESCRQLVSS